MSWTKYNAICPYFKELLDNFLDSNATLKNRITLKLLFISSKAIGEERESEMIIIMPVSDLSYLLKNIFNSILAEYQIEGYWFSF